jgi:heat-inducible transcriptional repressor
MTAPISLDTRSREILKEIIHAYISTGRAVGSRVISKKSRSHLGAASIRNIMSDLEEAGYLKQPHHSAGRVPTDKGYRFYVDSLMEKRRLSPAEVGKINETLASQRIQSFEGLMEKTSHLLSTFSNNVGIVLAPAISHTMLQHIQFLKLSSGRILTVLVGKSGVVQNKVIRVEDEISQEDLDRAGRYLTEEYSGKTLPVIRAELQRLLAQERAHYDRMLRQISLFYERAFDEMQSSQNMYLDGASNIINQPEFADAARMRVLFETFEQRDKLIRIISECIRDEASGVRILIGRETGIPSMQDCTIITSPYIYESRIAGSLGVLGPTRLEYGKNITLVDYVARLFGSILSQA